MNKCASDQKEPTDDIRGYSMTQFGGILWRQLLNLADIYDDRLKTMIPGSIKRTDVQRSNSFSSVSMAPSFSSTNILHSTGSNDSMTDVKNATFQDIVAEGKKDDDDDVEVVENGNTSVSSSQLDGRVCNSDVLVTYCDAVGVYHHGMKLQKKEQTTDGRRYTPTKKCCYPGCEKRTRVVCSTCNASFCYPLIKKGESRESMTCFVKHVRQVRRTQCTRQNRKKNGRFGK
jgi:hypothetical protein